MEDLNSRNPGGRAKAGDGQACFITAGIPCRTGHHTGRSAWSPTQLGVGEAAIDAGFQCFNKVALEAHQDGLGFRIAEAGIELQHLGAARRHHQPAIEHAGEGSVFACHAVNGRLRNVHSGRFLEESLFGSRRGAATMTLELRNVTKRFPGVLAVDDVSFSAPSGKITGYLGPNGSGKSTTMKM